MYCGDKGRCGSQYQDCWLKHLVSISEASICKMPLLITTALLDGHCSCQNPGLNPQPSQLLQCKIKAAVAKLHQLLQAHPGAVVPKSGPEIPWSAGILAAAAAQDTSATAQLAVSTPRLLISDFNGVLVCHYEASATCQDTGVDATFQAKRGCCVLYSGRSMN